MDEDVQPSSWTRSCNFRQVCKEFHGSALLPSIIKLCYRFGHLGSSLCNMTLSTSPPNPGPILPQGIQRDIHGDISLLLFHCHSLKDLTLNLGFDQLATGVLYPAFDPDIHGSNLSRLELYRPSSSKPCRLFSPLNLSFLPGLLDLTLKGPIVYGVDEEEEGGPLVAGPQLVPAHASQAIVTIDPGLGGRVPTIWARPVVSGIIAEMGSPLPLYAEYEEEDQVARNERINGFVSVTAEQYQSWPVFQEFPPSVKATIVRELSQRLHAELEEDRWEVNVIGAVVPLGRSDLLGRLNDMIVFEDMMDGLCEDVAAEIQSKFDAIEEMKAWLGI